MVKTKVMYLGPLGSITHSGPLEVPRTFFRDKWSEYDMEIDDILHYVNSGGFKVQPVSVEKKKIHPIVKEETETIIIGG